MSASAVSNFLPQDLRIEDVLHADAEPCRLVGVRGAHAPPRGSDLQLAEPSFARRVDGDVPRHDEVRVSGQPQAGRGNAARLELVELAHEEAGVDDAARADDAQLSVAEDPRRNVVQLEGLAVTHDRVSRVRSALVAADDVGGIGEQVDDLALAFIAPLGADDDGRGHVRRLDARAVGRPPHFHDGERQDDPALRPDAERQAPPGGPVIQRFGGRGVPETSRPSLRRPPGRRTSRSGARTRA